MKPSVLSVRRPVDPAAAEAFLAGQPFPAPRELPAVPSSPEAATAPVLATPPPANDQPTLAGRRIHERKDGRRVRRTTLLLEEQLARELDLASATLGVDKTAIMQAALRAWLAAQPR